MQTYAHFIYEGSSYQTKITPPSVWIKRTVQCNIFSRIQISGKKKHFAHICVKCINQKPGTTFNNFQQSSCRGKLSKIIHRLIQYIQAILNFKRQIYLHININYDGSVTHAYCPIEVAVLTFNSIFYDKLNLSGCKETCTVD